MVLFWGNTSVMAFELGERNGCPCDWTCGWLRNHQLSSTLGFTSHDFSDRLSTIPNCCRNSTKHPPCLFLLWFFLLTMSQFGPKIPMTNSPMTNSPRHPPIKVIFWNNGHKDNSPTSAPAKFSRKTPDGDTRVNQSLDGWSFWGTIPI